MKKLIFIVVLGVFIVSCTQEDHTSPTDEDNAPGPVKNVRVEPLPGGARLTYDLPKDESLRYVRAEYDIREGYSREVKSSLYKNSMVIDGFPDTSEYEVNLYAVSRGERSSEPVTITVGPLTPPLIEAYETLQFSPTFGGVTITFQNEGEAALAVALLVENSEGELTEVETYYTKSRNGEYSLRGFDAELMKFGAVVRDRWGNLSDTLTTELTPVFEELIPKDGFTQYNLPTDTYEPHATSAWNMTKLWDGIIGDRNSILHTAPGTGMPQWFTFDMGALVNMSRFVLHHRPGAGNPYQNGAPKRWEIWGSATVPDPSGSWDGWTLLMECESYKPSGDGPVTNEDINYATVQGENFTFTEDTPPVRYLRFKTLQTWGYLDYIFLAELTFYGDIQ